MGQTLSEPVTAKETTSCANDDYVVGASCMQGWRINMEDAHTHILSCPDDRTASFFAVYDGHGGGKVAQYAAKHLHKKICTHPLYMKGLIEDAIRVSFLELDSDMLTDDNMRDELAGTTAITVLIKSNKIYCGNVGDSRAVASYGGRVDALSLDHKPSNDTEQKRIIAAGGWVEFNRVNGNLALSRALGDFVFKRNDKKSQQEQIVTALPDIEVRDVTDELEFIVIACDGIWDVMTNEEVVSFIRIRIAAKMEPQLICEELMTRCLAPDCQMGGLGCDNMTVVLIAFLHGKNYEDLADKCVVAYGQKTGKKSLLSQSSSSTTSSISSDDEDVNPNVETIEKSMNGMNGDKDNDTQNETQNEIFSKLSASVNDSSLTVA